VTDTASVAVLWGDHGTFCAGADLKAFGTLPHANAVHRTGPGPMGPTRMMLSKPVIAAVSGYRGRRRSGARIVVRSASRRGGRRVWGVLPSVGSTADRRWHDSAASADRAEPGVWTMILTGRAVDATEALAIGLANRVVPKGQARAAAEELAAELAALPQQCMRSDRLSALHQWGVPETEALDHEFASISG